jgi:hypothetical protein
MATLNTRQCRHLALFQRKRLGNWRSQLDESAIEFGPPIASRRVKPDILTLNPTTRPLFSRLRWSDSAQGIRKIRYDVQRKREDRALCPTILRRNSAWA